MFPECPGGEGMKEFNRIIFGKNFGFSMEWDKSCRKWVAEFTEEELNLFIDRLESLNVHNANKVEIPEEDKAFIKFQEQSDLE